MVMPWSGDLRGGVTARGRLLPPFCRLQLGQFVLEVVETERAE
jgi:hypothetical protein